MLETLRQRRYLGLFGITGVVAIVCILAGSWQIARFHEKRDANHTLRTNNRDSTVSVSDALGPATEQRATGQADKFRHVTATGTYLSRAETLVRGQTVGGEVGYLVVTPLRTGTGVLLVVRGFVSQTAAAQVTPVVPAAPAGPVSITGRLEPAQSKADRLGALPANQVESINPVEVSARLHQPVWNAYAELLDGQPGTAGLTTIPSPDLSNPAGGAEEPQHAAYVVQWYLFAALALAMPFVLAAAERRRDAEDEQARSDAPAAKSKSRREQLDDRLAGKA